MRSELESLVRALAALSEFDRFRSDERAGAAGEQQPTLSWDDWESARGVVKLGGHAVEDCDGPYTTL